MSVHFDLPFRLDRHGSMVVNDQDSDEDIIASLKAILLWRRGHRLDRPDLGIDDPTFEQGGVNLDALHDLLVEQEPRAELLLARNPGLLTRMVDEITVDARRPQR